MDITVVLSSFYIPYSFRPPLPGLYVPLALSLCVIPFFIPSRPLAILSTFPLLFFLLLYRPNYTSGSAAGDYNSGVHGMFLAYLDFVILSLAEGEDVRYVGDGKLANGKGIAEQDLKSWYQRLIWTLRLMIMPNRGIGWNWRVKGVPEDPDVGLPKWSYVRRRVFGGLVTYLRSLTALYVLGMATTLQAEVKDIWMWTILNAVIGWCGAIWAWNGINFVNNFAAAITVSIGLCGQWEWPPMTGNLPDAWSVRQMWSTVYHQLIRRAVQQPGIRLARLLGFPKGSNGSSYTQLYIAFAISCLIHEANIFVAVRHDIGELVFFMSQPIAITFEDFVQWCYRKVTGRSKDDNITTFARLVGYAWMILWFSYSLPAFVKGLRDVGIIGDAIVLIWPFDVGSQHGSMLLKYL